MTSVNSNLSALSALREVNKLNNALAASANRIATGRRVASAQDGAAVWSIATRIEGETSVAGTVTDMLTVAKGILDAAKVGLTSTRTSLTDMRNLLVAARQNGANRTLIEQQITAIQHTMYDVASVATVDGVGLLREPAASPNPIRSFVSNLGQTAMGLDVSTINLDVREVLLINDATADGIIDKSRTVGGTTSRVLNMSVAGLTDAAADLTTIDNFIAMVDAALTETIAATSLIGTVTKRVSDRADFLEELTSIKEAAVSALVDANLEEEAAIKDALVVRQQLAIEALSISNSSLASILTLFQ